VARKIAEAARLMQIQMLDHVIMGTPANARPGYFSFQEARLKRFHKDGIRRCNSPSPTALERRPILNRQVPAKSEAG
jgi:RadC-like JAB domain-containing protein